MIPIRAWIGRVGLGLPLSFTFLLPVAQLLERPEIAYWDRVAAIGCAFAGVIAAFYAGRAGRVERF